MASKSWWLLPFGDQCDSQCQDGLDGFFYFFVAPVYVILTLALLAFLSKNMTYEIRKALPLDYDWIVWLSIVGLWILFWISWKPIKRIVFKFYCRHCR